MPDDLDDVECVAIVLADQVEREAVRFVREHTEISDSLPAMPSARMWRNIAEALDRGQRRQ